MSQMLGAILGTISDFIQALGQNYIFEPTRKAPIVRILPFSSRKSNIFHQLIQKSLPTRTCSHHFQTTNFDTNLKSLSPLLLLYIYIQPTLPRAAISPHPYSQHTETHVSTQSSQTSKNHPSATDANAGSLNQLKP